MSNLKANTVRRLLSLRNAEGVWEGHLASSALSTATAVIALSCYGGRDELVACGRQWLAAVQNGDGGWGDTVDCRSNISTTALCWAALPDGECAERARQWLARAAGSSEPEPLAQAIKRRYGKDQTFSVPILTALTIANRLGPGGWRRVPQLPFELAACPHQWFQFLRLPVVSYALPALIAIGLARHRARPVWGLAALRNAVTGRVLRVLQSIQPSCGGFLEATPLTSFVAMSLIAAGFRENPVTSQCMRFLQASIRPDGSWPIDTNLSTWVTTLAVNALDPAVLDCPEAIANWLLEQQFQTEHPYTHAAPGAWAWTNLPGAIPDADDTAGALLALHRLGVRNRRVTAAIAKGIGWLLDLQNRDGGIPTFCRGWGHLPFDRSGADLTAHALRAWDAWLPHVEPLLAARIRRAIPAAIAYLERVQSPDGSWTPLWFGNEHAPAEENRTFGTARVVLALRPYGKADAGIRWLRQAQNPDGGWGGAPGVPSSVEETALALAALAPDAPRETLDAALLWLENRTASGARFPYAPIGFYFASLWYHEELYPVLFTAAALQAVASPVPGAGTPIR
ncbi:MAG TPA: prenyltransferase/squalene oxidase repeat-containing protein [Bryobacteraceae bacterium]|nr:prenyltransferase/squalene oxidase repeat-containing protein [Bryobacteraceae bacterium]